MTFQCRYASAFDLGVVGGPAWANGRSLLAAGFVDRETRVALLVPRLHKSDSWHRRAAPRHAWAAGCREIRPHGPGGSISRLQPRGAHGLRHVLSLA